MVKMKKTLVTHQALKKRIKILGAEITRHYRGKPLVILGVLKGSFIFMADLVREIKIPLRCEFIHVSSYQGKQSGELKLDFDISYPIKGEHVLLVEDIVDTGKTLEWLMKHCKNQKPRSLKVCTLLYKPDVNPKIENRLGWIGFKIPNQYVVGYGMDKDGLDRSLPHIAIAK
ncbi:MAG: hypothetical protein ACD_73C00411G0002 [uncultured bacterium]|nr:MAG: hypothetical protein ACD_73C00411G0002 [uncultured bacterium]